MVHGTESIPRIARLSVQDIDDYRSCLKGRDILVKQLSSGYFNGKTTIALVGGISLVRRSASARYSSTLWLPEETNFLFPLAPGHIIAEGRSFDGTRQMATIGNRECHVIFPVSSDHFVISVPLQAWRSRLSEPQAEFLLDTLRTRGNFIVDPVRKQSLVLRVRQLFEEIISLPPALLAVAANDYSELLLDMLFDYVCDHSHLPLPERNNHERILMRALNAIEARRGQLDNLDALAREVFASKRAVQYAFSSIVGVSPMRYLKLHRFNLVRQELMSTQAPANFSSIIARYAFSNPGRAGREYAELFGERPRDTLRERSAEAKPAGSASPLQ